MTQLEDLKHNLETVEMDVTRSRSRYLAMKEILRQKESEMRLAKSHFNRAYKDWCDSRKEALRAKRRLQSYPYKIRKWAMEHFDKVWEMLEERPLGD
jgi:phage-related tail protein